MGPDRFQPVTAEPPRGGARRAYPWSGQGLSKQTKTNCERERSNADEGEQRRHFADRW